MSSAQESSKSLRDAWNSFVSAVQAKHSKQSSYAKVAQTKTAIIRYTLPHWGLPPPKGNKLTDWEIDQALELMATIDLKQVQAALIAQHQVFEEQQVPERVRRSYRSALNQFVRWCQEQSWFQEEAEAEQLQKPPKNRNRSAQDLRNRRKVEHQSQTVVPYRYALGAVEGDIINAELRKEIDEYTAFRLSPNLPTFKPVQRTTVNRELASIHQILGWLNRVKGVESEILCLTQLVPYIPVNLDKPQVGKREAKAAAQHSLALAFEYIDWLTLPMQEGGRELASQTLELSVLRAFLAIARFVYRNEISIQSTLKANQPIPVIDLLETEAKLCHHKRNLKQHKANTAKWLTDLDWNQVLGLVEQLRLECAPRALLEQQARKQPISLGPLRSLSAIAQSYQRFLLFALMAYLPPARQQTYRNLLTKQERSVDEIEPYGYCYEKDGCWYINFRQDAISAQVRERDYHLQIPNIRYSDGRCFYQYIEEWLKEYTYLNEAEEEVNINGLRQAFQPQHSHFFSKKNGLRYEDATEMSNLVRNAAYRLTGKLLTSSTISYLFLVQASLISRKRSIRALSDFILDDAQTHLTVFDLSDSNAVEAASKIARELAQKFAEVNL